MGTELLRRVVAATELLHKVVRHILGAAAAVHILGAAVVHILGAVEAAVVDLVAPLDLKWRPVALVELQKRPRNSWHHLIFALLPSGDAGGSNPFKSI